MPKIQIEVPDDEYQKLKELAKKDFRSLTNFITVNLIKLANENNNK